MRSNIVIVYTVFFCSSFLVFFYLGDAFGVGINLTASAPEGIYYYFPKKGLAVGAWVDFSLRHISWALSRGYVHKGEQIIKKIMGVPGDILLSRNHKIFLNHRGHAHWIYLGTCLEKDSRGRSMHCQQWSQYTIPKDHYYLGSIRTPFSFDSRYFGLVHRRNIRHMLRLLYAFK